MMVLVHIRNYNSVLTAGVEIQIFMRFSYSSFRNTYNVELKI